MEVEYVLKPEDVLAFARYHQAHLPKAWRTSPLIGVVVGLVLAGGAVLLQVLGLMPLLYSLGCLLVVSLFFALAARPLLQWSLKRKLNRGAYARQMGWRRLSISPEGLVDVTKHSRNEVKWAGVEKIALSGDYAFFYVTDVSAHILPRRPFASEEEFKQFVMEARRFRRAARESSADADFPSAPPDNRIRRGDEGED
jgi:hypothetical protein